MIYQRAGLRIFGLARGFASGKFVEEATSTDDFKKKIAAAKGPVLVDFYANWCGPCKALMPRLVKKAEQDGGKWTLLKVDIDNQNNEKVCEEFKVSAVPTLVLIKNGKEVAKKTGAPSDEALIELLK